jgi:hypothetical protein
MRLTIGVIARMVTYAAFVVIVGDAVLTLIQRGGGGIVTAVFALGFFPVTIVVWPWTHEAFGVSLIVFFVAAVVAYPISTFVGRLAPIN